MYKHVCTVYILCIYMHVSCINLVHDKYRHTIYMYEQCTYNVCTLYIRVCNTHLPVFHSVLVQ